MRKRRLCDLLGDLCAGVRREIRRNPSALADSALFHGERREVKRLSARERKRLPREVAVIGRAREIVYEAPPSSQRHGLWRHVFGDRGPSQPRSKRRPLVVEDPGTHRVELVGGDDRFDPMRGIIG